MAKKLLSFFLKKLPFNSSNDILAIIIKNVHKTRLEIKSVFTIKVQQVYCIEFIELHYQPSTFSLKAW